MRITVITFVLSMLVHAVQAPAGVRDDLTKELRSVQQRIERLESKGYPVPAELQQAEEALGRELLELDEIEFMAEKALELLAEISEKQVQRLRELRHHDEEEFYEILEEMLPWLEEAQEMRKEDPELYQLERRSHAISFECEHLADLAREAGDGEREKLVTELRKQVNELFVVRLQLQLMQIKRLEEELARFRKQVENMNSAKEDMIERRVQQLLSTDDW